MAKIIIAIDGHSSTGKSTVAKVIAKQLNYTYIDSGAMYRCVTLFGLRKGFVNSGSVNETELVASLLDVDISFRFVGSDQHAFLNGEDVEREIRGLVVSQSVSPVATIKQVREFLVNQQQKMGTGKGIVMDGRDIGTVVFPSAELKIFMTASAEIRAKRRYDELLSKGDAVSFEDILENVVVRDQMDENRSESPLKKASDAVLLDNGNMTRDEQLKWCLDRAEQLI